uniref:Uncharacterized protein n=1 Tax=Opuntia streptacantha TaxID=393608 RepID=A0A7C9A3G0_OPUST
MHGKSILLSCLSNSPPPFLLVQSSSTKPSISSPIRILALPRTLSLIVHDLRRCLLLILLLFVRSPYHSPISKIRVRICRPRLKRALDLMAWESSQFLMFLVIHHCVRAYYIFHQD